MLAAFLTDTANEEDAFAARLGGEEFLLVLCDRTEAEATSTLEALRRRVAAHPWHQAVGNLPATVSIGAAAVLPDSTQSTLLARADEQLYAAKRAGRNQVRTAVEPAPAVP